MAYFSKIKQDFPIFQTYPDLVYLDSAATSQKPRQVIDMVSNYYGEQNANIHRGIYKLAEAATGAYESARAKVAKFIGASQSHEIIFTRSATEAINLVASAWGHMHLDERNTVLLSAMEHHANIVPWQLARGIISAANVQAPHGLEIIKITNDYQLDLEDLEDKLKKNRVTLVAITHASNVLGTINPINKITSMAHEHGALVLVDGAQAIPHIKVDVQKLGADFYVFSGHKMLGPTGIGVLYAKAEHLEKMLPYQGGGEMIRKVSFKSSAWSGLPEKFEAGTPHIAGAIGLGAAIDYLSKIGMDKVAEHEQELGQYCLKRLSEISGLKIFGPHSMTDRVASFSFVLKGIHSHDLASILDEDNIAIRAGHHCAMPLHEEVLKIPATTRASLYIYNDKRDIDKLTAGLEKAKKTLS